MLKMMIWSQVKIKEEIEELADLGDRYSRSRFSHPKKKKKDLSKIFAMHWMKRIITYCRFWRDKYESEETKVELEKRKNMTQKINWTDQNCKEKNMSMIFKDELTNCGAGTWPSLQR